MDISETDRLRKEHDAEKGELNKQIGQLFAENVWLKKLIRRACHKAKKKLNGPSSEIKRQCILLKHERPHLVEYETGHQLRKITVDELCTSMKS